MQQRRPEQRPQELERLERPELPQLLERPEARLWVQAPVQRLLAPRPGLQQEPFWPRVPQAVPWELASASSSIKQLRPQVAHRRLPSPVVYFLPELRERWWGR